MSEDASGFPPLVSPDAAALGYDCDCLVEHGRKGAAFIPTLHVEAQDPGAAGWRQLTALIDDVARSGAGDLAPGMHIAPDDWHRVIILPPEIASLTRVRGLRLYGSSLRRLTPEIGRMSALRTLDIYTSYALHWLPYEVTRCEDVYDSRMSTRALYGNRKTRLPFPRLSGPVDVLMPETCSVCDLPFEDRSVQLYWTTQRIGTDDVPLLIHSCSDACTDRVPSAPPGYIARPHKGGSDVVLPADF